jgi:hypothetical protein
MYMDEMTFEQDVDGLIEWCEDLDYNKYIDNWNVIATSAKHEALPDDDALHVLEIDRSLQSREQPGDPVRLQRLEEDLYAKQNLQYENRLKEHLYLF